jgi:hypothetical protein
MRPILRSGLAVLLGALAASAVIMAVEFLDATIYPSPPGMDPNDPDSVKSAMAALPIGALLLVLLGWIVGTFAGAWIAARLAPRSPIVHGLIVGVLLLAGGIYNMLEIPHPLWFWVLGVAVFLPSAYLGARLAAGGAGRDRSLATA